MEAGLRSVAHKRASAFGWFGDASTTVLEYMLYIAVRAHETSQLPSCPVRLSDANPRHPAGQSWGAGLFAL